MAEFERLDFPRQTYEDWKLFQEQDNLRRLYLSLLDVDPEKAMAESNKANVEYQQAFDAFRQAQGIANDNAFIDIEQEAALHREFRRQFKPGQTNHVAAILIVWEMWAELQAAEQFFRNRMAAAGVRPQDAFEALSLSNRHRRAMGQWEQAGAGMWQLHYVGGDIPHPDPEVRKQLAEGESPYQIEGMVFKEANIEHSRDMAEKVLGAFSQESELTPFSAELAARAREEIANSVVEEIEERWGNAFQWASDAIVTARSARALYELEMEHIGRGMFRLPTATRRRRRKAIGKLDARCSATPACPSWAAALSPTGLPRAFASRFAPHAQKRDACGWKSMSAKAHNRDTDGFETILSSHPFS